MLEPEIDARLEELRAAIASPRVARPGTPYGHPASTAAAPAAISPAVSTDA